MRQKSLSRTILEPLAIAIALAILVRSALHIYSIPSASMAPTLHPGDQIVVTPYFRHFPESGHVIVFESPQQPGELIVKRVIAGPGELIDSRLGRVRVGGYTLAEPYVLHTASTGSIAAQIVPADSYFVLGDNREDSVDSRSWGFVPRSHIVGRARVVLWSSAPHVGDAVRADAMKRAGGEASLRGHGSLFKWIE
jgi:signal peptidase I